MTPRVLVLGEGQDEEGADYYVAHDPGQPVDEERLGSAHVLVRRIFHEILTVTTATIVAPPRLRSKRRPGNQGLCADLEGRPRSPHDSPRKDGTPRGWLSHCIGRNRVDVAVVLKDAARRGREEEIRSEIRHATAGRFPPGLRVIPATATPSIEGWLLLLPETDGVTEAEAKREWELRHNPRDPSVKAGVAQDLDLDRLVECNPSGFGELVSALREWWAAFK